MVVLKELILNSFYIRTGCGGLERTHFKQFNTLGECSGGLEGTNFEQFLLWEGVTVLKVTDLFRSFNIQAGVVAVCKRTD